MCAKNKVVQLNIGGKIFQTTTDTLTQKGTNFFTALLDGSIDSTRDENGAYFIDRNGTLFEPLLDFLRSGNLFIHKGLSRAAILEEANFYSIELPESEYWTENRWEYCILEISAKYMARSKIFFRLYHESVPKPEVVGEISTAGYWEVSKKCLFAKIVGTFGRTGWQLSQVLGTEHDDGSVPESYVFSKHCEGRGQEDFQNLLELLKKVNTDNIAVIVD